MAQLSQTLGLLGEEGQGGGCVWFPTLPSQRGVPQRGRKIGKGPRGGCFASHMLCTQGVSGLGSVCHRQDAGHCLPGPIYFNTHGLVLPFAKGDLLFCWLSQIERKNLSSLFYWMLKVKQHQAVL